MKLNNHIGNIRDNIFNIGDKVEPMVSSTCYCRYGQSYEIVGKINESILLKIFDIYCPSKKRYMNLSYPMSWFKKVN